VQIESKRLVKMRLPDGRVLDINDTVFELISKYIQTDVIINESGGFLIGYTEKKKKSVVIETITEPQIKDLQSRVSFCRKDPAHLKILEIFRRDKSDYLGTWHTHPQNIPFPSKTDLKDWEECLSKERTSNGYILFLIWGYTHFRVWVGDIKTRKLYEIEEWPSKNKKYISQEAK